MDAERFQLLSRLFTTAIALDASLRAAFVEAHCAADPELRGELTRLLAAHDQEEGDDALLEGGAPLISLPSPLRAAPEVSEELRQVGRYRVIRPIASGGMGTVYAAEQDEPRRMVAVKVLHAGLSDRSVIRRFEQEAQILARLRHPGIAHVYEIGTFGSAERPRPFIAMELIDGVPLGEHARRAELDVDACLELVAEIADAVDFAHRAGVIHRDLKPANILIDREGRPRILDFGVARAIGNDSMVATMRTETGQLIGTMPYMSPEQAGGRVSDIDVRTDVYALGVVAYELLAGRLPYDLEGRFPHEVLRIIREEEPTRLSTVNRALRGDIETVIAHALAKEPARRYQSAAEFAADLRRSARREAIRARPPSRLYRMRTFTRRNRGLVVGTLGVFLVLSGGIVATSLALVRALDAETLAAERLVRVRQEAEKAQAVSRFLQEMLAAVDPRSAVDPDLRMRDVLDAAAARLDAEGEPLVPEVDAAIRHTIASTYRALGAYVPARRYGEDALRIRRQTLGDNHLETADTMAELSEILRESGDLDGAEALSVEVLRIRRGLLTEPNAMIATSLNNLALVRNGQGRGEEARRLNEDALAMRRALYDGDHMDIITSLNNLALTVFRHEGDAARAESLMREAVAMLERTYPDGHVNLASSLDSLASLSSARSDLVEAEQFSRAALAMRERLLPPGHELIGEGLSNLGLILRRQGRLDEAEPLYRESLAIRRAAWSGDHAGVATALNNLGQLLRLTDREEEAESMLTEALQMRRRLFPGDQLIVAISLNNLGLLLAETGRPDEGATLLEEAVAIAARLPGDRRLDQANYAAGLALAHRARGALDDAAAAAELALALVRDRLGPIDPQVAQALLRLARIMLERDGAADAEPIAVEAMTIIDQAPNPPEGLRERADELLAEIQAELEGA